jgi:peroxiredoxin
VPKLKELYKKYKDKGFIIIGVHTDQDAAKMPAFVKKQEIDWPIVVDDGDKTSTIYGVEGYPTTYLIDKTGKVVAVDDDEPGTIEKLLKEGSDEKKSDEKKPEEKKSDDK